MKHIFLTALLALIIFIPARAQQFSDSLRISLLTCSAGADAYERFGHAAIRIQDQRDPRLDVVYHYGVFSFDAPHFIYRFVKGETDYMLGAEPAYYFIQRNEHRGLGMTEQVLQLDSAQSQELLTRLLINYRPENRTYRYSYFFDNCSTRPYHLLNAATHDVIRYDSTWVNAISLREMVQQCVGVGSWLDFGIALAVAHRADQPTTYEEQLFLPGYLSQAVDHALIPVQVDGETATLPLVSQKTTLLDMHPELSKALHTEDPVKPATVFALVLMLGMLLTAFEWRALHTGSRQLTRSLGIGLDAYDTVFFLFLGITGCIVWFLNFFSLHPAVDHNINCLWLLPTHVIMAVVLWWKKARRACRIYFGITFAAVIVYVIADWIVGQYCPPAFLLILATVLLRSYMRFTRNDKPQD